MAVERCGIGGATSATLSLTGVTAGQAGSYSCRGHQRGRERHEQRGDLDGERGTRAPTITTQPASQTVTAGANVSFTVAASGHHAVELSMAVEWSEPGWGDERDVEFDRSDRGSGRQL